MNLLEKCASLQNKMRKLACKPDRYFYYNYVPLACNGCKPRPDSPRERLRKILSSNVPLRYMWKWNSMVNYADRIGQTVVCWSALHDREILRKAALGLDAFFKTSSLVPVLVSAIADFSFFARLGWQMEYLPKFAGKNAYAKKKARYLALRYRDAFFLPIEAGLASKEELALLCREYMPENNNLNCR